MRQKHGLSKTRLYRIWAGMKARCNNPDHPSFKYYGAKNIRVCNEWENDFLLFRDWALSHGYEDNLTIDRIDPNGNYEPDNCQWLTLNENAARTKYSKTKSSYLAATKGFRKWYNRQYEIHEANERIADIDKVMKELPDLSNLQLELLLDFIKWVKAQETAYQRKEEAFKDYNIAEQYKKMLKERDKETNT